MLPLFRLLLHPCIHSFFAVLEYLYSTVESCGETLFRAMCQVQYLYSTLLLSTCCLLFLWVLHCSTTYSTSSSVCTCVDMSHMYCFHTYTGYYTMYIHKGYVNCMSQKRLPCQRFTRSAVRGASYWFDFLRWRSVLFSGRRFQ